MLRLSMSGVMHRRKKGLLKGEYKNHAWWYTPEEVDECRRYMQDAKPLRKGELAGAAFDAFAEGASIQTVVRALRVTTQNALRLYREYDPGLMVIGSEQLAALRARLEIRGYRARSVGELLDSIDRLCARDARLVRIELAKAPPAKLDGAPIVSSSIGPAGV